MKICLLCKGIDSVLLYSFDFISETNEFMGHILTCCVLHRKFAQTVK